MPIITRIQKKIWLMTQNKLFKYRKVCFGWNSYVQRSKFLGNNTVGNDSVVVDCVVGKNSYFGNNVSFSKATIGSFCSVGDNIKVIAAQHPIDTFISTSPMFYTQRNILGAYVSEEKFPNFRFVPGTTHSVLIGNDVWIGSHTLIIGGVTIGNGSIIAAGSVVTKDVAPYSIVGGVPAKFIRYRFSDDIIETLENIKWWDKSDKWLYENGELFSDIHLFIDKFKDGKE